MVIREIFKTHKKNIALARELVTMNNLLVNGMGVISQFWLVMAEAGFLDEERGNLGEASHNDAMFSFKILMSLEAERNADLGAFMRMTQRSVLRLLSWLTLLMNCVFKFGNRKYGLENATEAHKALENIVKEKAEIVKVLATNLMGIQGLMLSIVSNMPDETTCPFPLSFAKDIPQAMNATVEYLKDKGHIESASHAVISLSDLVEGGMTQEEALEFVADFSASAGEDAMNVKSFTEAIERGDIIGYAMRYLREKHGEH